MLHSVLLFTGTFKHYGKKVPHLPLDIQLEIELNSSAVTHLSLKGLTTVERMLILTDWNDVVKQWKIFLRKCKTSIVYLLYFSWNSLLETHEPLTLKPDLLEQHTAITLLHTNFTVLFACVCQGASVHFSLNIKISNRTQNKEVTSRLHFLEALSLHHQGHIIHLQGFWKQTRKLTS